MVHLYCYRIEEAIQIKEMYASWIGKEAHVGKGVKETLYSINITPRRNFVRSHKTDNFYKVEFQFQTKKHFSAHEFLLHNSLVETYTVIS